MNPADQRELVVELVKIRPAQARELALYIEDPWYRAQAMSWVARFTDGDPIAIAAEAANAAREGHDDYRRSAVRAWEIAALAERGCIAEARQSLCEAVATARISEPPSSRSEALLLLLQAAFRIGRDEAADIHATLQTTCPVEEHWRCRRAVRYAGQMMAGEFAPRDFFW